MKRWFKMLTGSFAVVFFIAFSCAAFAAAPVKLRTAWLDEHEAFLVWYAKEKGWDKEEGLDIEMLLFSSGMAQLNALPAGEWVLAGTGAVPGMMGALRYGTYTVAVTNDESYTNGVLVRPDSPIAKVKGWNKEYPDVLGSPETVRGKTFLCTTMSSPHMALSSWLKVLGLTDKDVVIKNMDQPQALGAFENGTGDGVALWAPHLYVGEAKGWKLAGNIKNCGQTLPIVIQADKKYADAHPEVITGFLRAYMRGIHMLKNEPAESLVPLYRRFFMDWAGQQYTPEVALKDIKTHPVFNYEEQLRLLDNSRGMSEAQQCSRRRTSPW